MRASHGGGCQHDVQPNTEGHLVGVFALDIADGMVQAIRSVVNPDKLRHLESVSDVARRPERTWAEMGRG